MKWVWRIIGTLAVVLVAAFSIFRTPDTDPDAMRAKYGGAPSQFVTLADGQTVHLRDEGPRDASAIILLHGSNADLHTWQPWVDALKTDYRVIRFDQIGHGLTGPSRDGAYAIADFVADVDAVADLLGLERFILGGNSMGGGISVHYALAHPDRVKGLVLVDAAGAPVDRPQKSGGNIGFTIASMPGVNKIMEHITPRSLVEESFRQSISNQSLATPQTIDRYWELLRYPGNRAATIARFTTPRSPLTAQQVAGITVPTLIIWGEEDALIPVDAGRWYDATLPNAELLVLPAIGHLPMEEAPDETINALKTWLVASPLTGSVATGSAGEASSLQ